MFGVRTTFPLLGPAELDALRTELLTSPLVAPSTLAGPFRGSRGFSAIFTLEGRPGLVGRFPALAPFLEQVTGHEARRVRPRCPSPDAFYLNLLVVEDGAGVARHVDATLRKPSGDGGALPLAVSVLYLEEPGAGGSLEVFTWPLARRIRPRVNRLVTFRGDLPHRVLDGPPARRTSLVLEQYHLGVAAAALPHLQVDSRAGFAAFLELHRRPDGRGRR